MIRYLLVFLWCLAFSNVLQANPDSLIKVSINGFMNFLEHDQKNIDLGKHSQVIYSFDGLQNLDYRDSLYVNGGEYNRMFSSTETNYKDAWKLINNFNDDGDNTYIYVFHGKYFFNRKGLGEGFNDQEWDKYLNVSKLSKTTKQKKIFSSLIVDELYEKVKTKYPQKKIAIVYVFEEFTATKSSDKGNLYSTNNPIGSLNGKNLYYKDFRIFWNYINFNAFEKGIWMQEKYRQVSSIPFGQSGSASSEDYGKAFLQTVRNKIEASKEAKEALYPDLPPRERLYAHKLKQANFDPSKVSGFAELKPNGFMYNWNAAYNIISEKKRQNPNFDLSTINAILGSYYFDNSLVAGQTLNLSIKDITKFDPKTQSNQNMLMAHFFGRIKWANEIHYKKVFLQSLAYGLIVEISLPASSPLKARLKSQNDKLLDALESYEGGNPNFRTHFATLRQDVQKARMPALVTTTPTTTVSPWTVLLVPLKAIQDYYLPALFEEIDQSAILSACYPVYETLREASEIVDFDAINAVLGDDKESKLYEILKKLYKNQADDDLRDLANLENKIYTGQTLTDNEWERYKDLLCRIKGDCRDLEDLKKDLLGLKQKIINTINDKLPIGAEIVKSTDGKIYYLHDKDLPPQNQIIGAIELEAENSVTIAIYRKDTPTKLKGRDIFFALLNHIFLDGINIDGINGRWNRDSDNTKTINDILANKKSITIKDIEEAAWQTWTGERVKELKIFTQIEVESFEPAQPPFTKVYVKFKK